MKRFSLPTLLLVMLLAVSACSFSINTGATAEPTIIYVPVTVTPAPTQPPPTDTPAPLPTETALPTATIVLNTATPEVLHFYVSGMVWLDTCKPYDAVPTPIPSGCLWEPGIGLTADGVYSAGEPGLAGVTVRLAIDCNYGAFTTTTDNSGYYKMSFTVPKSAGVGEQRICVSVDATSAENASILLPGAWTHPSTRHGTATVEITIPVEQQNTVNFGWDYQFQ